MGIPPLPLFKYLFTDNRGAFSVVKKGIRKADSEKVALKFIEKKFVKKKHIEQLR